MPKKTVKRCIRPQCMEIYEETEKNRFCMSGALHQITEIDIKPKKSTYKKPANTSKPKTDYIPKQDEVIVSVSNEEEIKPEQSDVVNDNTEDITVTFDEVTLDEDMVVESENEDFVFFESEDVVDADNEESDEESNAYLYLLLEEEDVEFELSNVTRIGRAADGVQVDIDLSEYAEKKDVSREHAVIRKEKDGYYITNVSRNHSVRLMDQDDNEVALEYGKRALLRTGVGIILSKKILLQFEEEE